MSTIRLAVYVAIMSLILVIMATPAQAKEIHFACQGEGDVSFLVHVDKEKAQIVTIHTDGSEEVLPLVRADSKFLVAKHEDGFYLVFRNDGAWIITADGKNAISGGRCGSLTTL